LAEDAMPRPTPTQLAFARSTLPVRRVASVPASPQKSPFATVLQQATAANRPVSTARPVAVRNAPMISGDGPAAMSRSEMVANAEQLMGVPYVWGGTSASGLDCSAFISKVWGVGRHTTDTLASVARPVSKDELQAGDALNLTTARDSDGAGHVRMFDRWANPEKTKMWVYEETPPRSIHHVINWDPSYQPMRRTNTLDA
jgi:cell wall-associated NlpC family hydrolase